MTPSLDDRLPITVLRRAVHGFLAGFGLGALFVAAVFLFDVGGIATMASHAPGGLRLADLGLLPVTFGLFGLIAAPTVVRARRSGLS